MSVRRSRLHPRGAAAALATATVVGLVLRGRVHVRERLDGLGGEPRRGSTQSLDDMVTGVAAGGLVMVLAGLAGSLLLTLIDVLAQERWQWLHQMSVTCCPAWGRRLVLTLCGVGMVLPATAAAASSVADDRGPSDCRPSCAIRLDGLPLPDLPTRLGPLRQHLNTATVTVRPGDCLWAIAERSLPRHASNAAISRHVDAWYAANAATIGPDPDLIFPGTHLDRPEVLP